MKQIFTIGASSVYGVGGEDGGWADMLKRHLHQTMYGERGTGETCELFNFSKSGCTTDFVQRTFPEQLKEYGRSGEVTVILSVGGNDSKATGTPENYVTTPEEYGVRMRELLTWLKANVTKVIVVGNAWVDEDKTNPKISPFDGSKSFFTNDRFKLFRQVLEALCDELEVTFVGVDKAPEEWLRTYQHIDGLHPNDAGYKYIFAKLLAEI